MKALQSKWIAIAVPVAGILGAIASVIWADDAVRLKMVTALGVLVLTRYVIRWIYEYGGLVTRDKDTTRYDRWERNLVWLFQSQLTDSNELGTSHRPVHIKLDTFDLQGLTGDTHRMHERLAKKMYPAAVEVPEWWLRRMPHKR